MLKTVFFLMGMDGMQLQAEVIDAKTIRPVGAVMSRELLERRYPYLSGGARAGLGT